MAATFTGKAIAGIGRSKEEVQIKSTASLRMAVAAAGRAAKTDGKFEFVINTGVSQVLKGNFDDGKFTLSVGTGYGTKQGKEVHRGYCGSPGALIKETRTVLGFK